MRVKILGSAAGGGFPQWNCACRNCGALRAGTFSGKARSQAQVAVSADGRSWFLLGASPDLRSQIEATPELHPHEGIRQSPISGVVLGSPDLDHVLGLLLLRELQPFRVYGTPTVLRILRETNSMFGMLNRIPQQVSWCPIRPGERFALQTPAGAASGLICEPVPLGTRYPAYVARRPDIATEPQDALLGPIIESSAGKRIAYMSAVSKLDDALLAKLDTCDVVLFDGTFWSDDELIRVQGSGETAHQMGHIPVGGRDGTLRLLSELRRPRKIYLHINNTNPMLDEAGPEYRAVHEAGCEVAEDGWQVTL
jgi:pyrroloquinoline quinone biosynthesis protein B